MNAGQGTKILHATWQKERKKEEKRKKVLEKIYCFDGKPELKCKF